MKTAQPISVLFAATVSALFQGAVAVLAIPCFSFLLLLVGSAPAQLKPTVAAADHGMLFAIAAPFCWAAIGFVSGAMMAWTFNLLIHRRSDLTVVASQTSPAQAVAVSDAA